MQQQIMDYFREGLWQQKTETEEPQFKAYLVRLLKIVTLSAHAFIKDNGSLRASALTLYSLLSVVPVIAMLFGIAKGFGFEQLLQQRLLEQVPEQNELIGQLFDMARNLLDSTKGGVVAGFGVAILFWTVLKVISNIEESFNYIWKVGKPRAPGRKLNDYLSVMLLAPLLIIAASSISIYVQTQLASLINAIALPGTIIALKLLSYLPILILWGLFSFVFIFMPNTTVSYRSGLFAGIISGTIYYIVQSLYVSLQIGVTSYNAIYGSFAALPLFLVWLQITWIIVLTGSELSFFHQNLAFYQFNQHIKNLSFVSRVTLAQQIMHLIMDRFKQVNATPYSVEDLSIQLQLPISLIQPIIDELIECHLLSKLDTSDKPTDSYQPACAINLLSDDAISEALKNNGESYTALFNQVSY
ncbi:hypothetical protein AU255_08420 [Methyloprofundus sedimenti]|uniref:Uncharacterized protein n=1 Tax=Methyloprofundus sedimenti TaxID=1420851 RepID=A0A1V8M8F6_9GAMM|nr:YihY/virulence factor BrkB family protein [Methyloprofundus sedimenti]OQK17870.1 hypothetical protein AU255_08420 [Methyloprofundus sedimenti]